MSNAAVQCCDVIRSLAFAMDTAAGMPEQGTSCSCSSPASHLVSLLPHTDNTLQLHSFQVAQKGSPRPAHLHLRLLLVLRPLLRLPRPVGLHTSTQPDRGELPRQESCNQSAVAALLLTTACVSTAPARPEGAGNTSHSWALTASASACLAFCTSRGSRATWVTLLGSSVIISGCGPGGRRGGCNAMRGEGRGSPPKHLPKETLLVCCCLERACKLPSRAGVPEQITCSFAHSHSLRGCSPPRPTTTPPFVQCLRPPAACPAACAPPPPCAACPSGTGWPQTSQSWARPRPAPASCSRRRCDQCPARPAGEGQGRQRCENPMEGMRRQAVHA